MSDSDEESAPASSGSTTPNSTSTYRFSHETFDTLQHKILALAHSLGDFENVTLERLRGGDFNRVCIVRFTKKDDDQIDGILRIPRSTCIDRYGHLKPDEPRDCEVDDTVQDKAAILQHLARKEVQVPRLLAFDATAANAIEKPFLLLALSPGTPLHTLYDSMTFSEKLEIVDAFVSCLLTHEQTTFSQSGTLIAAECSKEAAKKSLIDGMKDIELYAEVQQTVPDVDDKTLAGMIGTKLQEYYEENERDFGESIFTEQWRRLLEILREMQKLQYFEPWPYPNTDTSKSVLYHWDLEPRNILVKRLDIEHPWTIDMAIDWDEAVAVPPLLARKPPTWLWDFCDDTTGHESIDSGYDGDADLLDPTRYDRSSARLAPDDQHIRDRFESAMVDGLRQIHPSYNRDTYLEETYGKGRWVRRLARFAINGTHSTYDDKRIEHFVREWSKADGDLEASMSTCNLEENE
jgi:hypothetical protein